MPIRKRFKEGEVEKRQGELKSVVVIKPAETVLVRKGVLIVKGSSEQVLVLNPPDEGASRRMADLISWE